MPPVNDASILRERVAWDKRGTVVDEYGNETGAFVEQFTSRANYTHLRGGEAVLAARLAGRQPVVVRVRSSANSRAIAPDWRMRDLGTGVNYAVRSVAPAENVGGFWLDILVESGVAQ